MEYPTPQVSNLLLRLSFHLSDLTTQIERLQTHFQTENCLVLSAAVENIIDRKKEKERLKRRWKIILREILEEPIIYDQEYR